MVRALAVVAVVLGFALSGCGGSSPGASRHGAVTATANATTSSTASTTSPAPSPERRSYAPDAFDAADAALEERVTDTALSGGVLRIVAADGAVLHEHSV